MDNYEQSLNQAEYEHAMREQEQAYKAGIKRIVELLNKYEKERIVNKGGDVEENDNYFGRDIEDGKIVNWDYDPDAHSFMNEYIISRKFEFIKWLVEKGYINVYKIHDTVLHSGWLYHGKDKTTADRVNENYVDILTMILSIEYEPVKYLISYLM